MGSDQREGNRCGDDGQHHRDRLDQTEATPRATESSFGSVDAVPLRPVPTLRSHVPWRDDQAGVMEIVEHSGRQMDVHGAARAVHIQQAVGRE
jgi:hypothetical protein